MNDVRYSRTFAELVASQAHDAPQALLLDWWCRLERILSYYYIAYFGEHPRSAFVAIELVARDVRISQFTVDALHRLRVTRNKIAHGHAHITAAEEAASYAAEAHELAWRIGACVPDELALSSGAANVA